ncbi:hypothetical protein LCGC14_1786040 [marine sediment metagenome]|uniref:Uncharacterized protein n=1 Tax=marine sediment metagenome TaxID=412755 RepID=A0A0F9GU51_9ZZZZ
MIQFKRRRYTKDNDVSYYCWLLVNGIKVGNAAIIHDTLFNFNISTKYRNRGYASTFMAKIIEDNGNLKRLHVKSCDLKNGLLTDELVKFYKKYGFKIKNTTHPYGILMLRKVTNHCAGV